MSKPAKTTVHLLGNGLPTIKKNTYACADTMTCAKIITVIRKHLAGQISENDTLFLYFKEFAIYPDTTIGEIIEHVPGTKEIDINYSCRPAYG